MYTLKDLGGNKQTVHFNRLLPFYTRKSNDLTVVNQHWLPTVPRFNYAPIVNETETVRSVNKQYLKLKACEKARLVPMVLNVDQEVVAIDQVVVHNERLNVG